MRNKKGSVTGSTLLDLIIVAVLLVIAFFLIRDYILKPGGMLYKYNIEAKCLDLYRQNDLMGKDMSAKTCTNNEQNNGCPETKKYCCDLYPDDGLKESEKSYLGCCIPDDKKDICPKSEKEGQARPLSGTK